MQGCCAAICCAAHSDVARWPVHTQHAYAWQMLLRIATPGMRTVCFCLHLIPLSSPSIISPVLPPQYLYLLLSVAVLLPISLGVDGTHWSANFRGWTAGDWAVLCVMSCCVVISANLCIQYATWVLGAPTVSMFYGLRLVAAIVESKIILGATVIKEPVQASLGRRLG